MATTKKPMRRRILLATLVFALVAVLGFGGFYAWNDGLLPLTPATTGAGPRRPHHSGSENRPIFPATSAPSGLVSWDPSG